MMVSILKFVSLLIALWFTEINIMRFIRNADIPPINFFYQSVSIVLFIFLQFKLF
jgi:hypothetical protein